QHLLRISTVQPFDLGHGVTSSPATGPRPSTLSHAGLCLGSGGGCRRLAASLLQSVRQGGKAVEGTVVVKLLCLGDYLGPAPGGNEGEGHSLLLFPCFPFQNGQKGQSSPCGKSSPSSCGQPMLPSVIATCLTPCWRKKSFNSCCTFGFVVTSVATQRIRIGSAPSCRITPAAIFVVVLVAGRYMGRVPMGYCGCCRPAPRPRSSSPPLP